MTAEDMRRASGLKGDYESCSFGNGFAFHAGDNCVKTKVISKTSKKKLQQINKSVAI